MKTMSVSVWGTDYEIPVFSHHTVVVGTGAAGYNAADTLYAQGIHDVVIVTEGVNMGTSRNTGSDKQTYYKLTMAGGMPDSVRGMAQTLFDCGSMHGDLALAQAAGSARAFFRLVSLGVPFPQNEMGEYVGYKTDHDPAMRATSCGPLTSKKMTEALQRAVAGKQIPVMDECRVIRLLTEENTVRGFAALCPTAVTEKNPAGLLLFFVNNLVWAVGGPAGIYHASVYPESQTCALGTAFWAGAGGSSLTESQYGIASVKFRWNLSGTYQQVIPRYISVDKQGVEREFLDAYFPDKRKLLTAIFLKGYEWPFDPRKLWCDGRRGSSAIDLAVFAEIQKGNRVYLDYMRNPSCAEINGSLDMALLEETPLAYLRNSDALLPTPIARLRKMNDRAVRLYADNGIDLTRERLEIAVSAQHCNGGLTVTGDWESPDLHRFYPVGECAGTFGICRPGGTALNATQVDSYRAACHIAKTTAQETTPENVSQTISAQAEGITSLTAALLDGERGKDICDILSERATFTREYDACGAFLRNTDTLSAMLDKRKLQIAAYFTLHRAKDFRALRELFINHDILVTQYVFASAMCGYAADGGLSRGSALYTDADAETILSLEEPFPTDTVHFGAVEETRFDVHTGTVENRFVPVRPIPAAELWFETVYNRGGHI